MINESDLRQMGYHLVDGKAVRVSTVPDDMPEGTLLAEVQGIAKARGFLVYHTYRSTKSPPGFPDLCLARPASTSSPGRLILAELKTRTGKLTPEQALWVSVLEHTVPGVEVYVWRPSDLSQILDTLRRTS
jgi:hypothetical protein